VSAPSISEPVFDEAREQPGFECRRARLGRQLGSEKLGLSLWEVPAGQTAYPFHFHLAEEEILIVLEGSPSLRDADGWRQLEEGEAVRFAVGEEGAHQIANRGEAPVRFLAISNQQPDVVVRPGSNTLSVFERLPQGGGLAEHFRRDDAVGYYEGEDSP
jgi:uncharacterized cupin superfamily protein